jgi:uncharacterized protein (TIGR02246 family)
MNLRLGWLALGLNLLACSASCPTPSTPSGAASAVATTLPVPPASAPPADDATIAALITSQAETWNRHDAAAWVAPFDADAEFVNIVGMRLSGKEQIQQRHAELFQSIFSHSSVVVTTGKLTRLGADAAVVDTVYELRGYDRLPPGIRPTDADGTLRTRMRYVLTHRSDGWHVVAAQNTAIFPPPDAKP